MGSETRPTRREATRIRTAAWVGAIIGIPLAVMAPGYLWVAEQWLKPGVPTDLERSAMAMSVMGLMFAGVLFGPPLGAAVGAAWMAWRLRLPQVAGRWCVRCGMGTAAGVTGICLIGGDPAEQLIMMLLPWRAGHLLWSLLVAGWGIWTLRRSAS